MDPESREAATEEKAVEEQESTFGWEIMDADDNVLKPYGVTEVVKWLLSEKVSLDARCFNRSEYEEWLSKPEGKKSKKEKRMSIDSFRGTLRNTLGRQEFDIHVLFAPVRAWMEHGFLKGFAIAMLLLGTVTFLGLIENAMEFHDLGVIGAVVFVILLILTIPTIVLPFVIALVVTKMTGQGDPKTFPIAVVLSLLACGVAAAITGGIPGAIVGYILGLRTPKQLS